MSTKIQSSGDFYVQVEEGNGSHFKFNQAGDIILSNPARKSDGRALVAYHKDQLVVNFKNDFKGGVMIYGLKSLQDIPDAPSGMKAFHLVVDEKGNVYKAP
jgi:hypothetical protein